MAKIFIPSNEGLPKVLSDVNEPIEIPSGTIVTSTGMIDLNNLSTNLSSLQDVNLTNLQDGQVIQYDAANNEWVNATLSLNGATTFIALGDTPASYSGAGYLLRVNTTNDGLEFFQANYVDASNPNIITDLDMCDHHIINLADPVNNLDAVNLQTLINCINAEATARDSADTDLQNQINNLNTCTNNLNSCVNTLRINVDSLNTCTSNLVNCVCNIENNGVSHADDADTLQGHSASDFALANHNHDDRYYTQTDLNNGVLDSRYYTETELDSLLSNKADASHSHALDDLTNVNLTGLAGGCVLCYDTTNNEWVPGSASSGTPAGTFKDLTDTPNDYTGNADKIVVVNSSENGLTFVSSVSNANAVNGVCVNDSDTSSSSIWTAQKINDTINSYLSGMAWQDPIISFYDPTSSLPSNPNVGDRYIASATANGWTKDNIYEYDGSSWDETVPQEHFTLWNNDDDKNYTYNGTSWVIFNGGTSDHNSLIGLQGNGPDYYHLDSSEYNDLIGGSVSNLHTHTFLQLNETPSSYSSQGNKVLAVNNAEDGIVFVDLSTQYASINHNHDTCYYTQDCLNNGVLDSRYYTQTQLDTGALDSRYYTESELNTGSLDSRYYTETEVDTLLSNKADASHTHALNDLSDVDTSGATDGYVLTYTSTGNWAACPAAGGGGGGSVPDGQHVYDHLEWLGSGWAPTAVPTFVDCIDNTTCIQFGSGRTTKDGAYVNIIEGTSACSHGLLNILSCSTDLSATAFCVMANAIAGAVSSCNTSTFVFGITNNSTCSLSNALEINSPNNNNASIKITNKSTYGIQLENQASTGSGLYINSPSTLALSISGQANRSAMTISGAGGTTGAQAAVRIITPNACCYGLYVCGLMRSDGFGSFTGFHEAIINEDVDIKPGMLVAAYDAIAICMNDSVFKVNPTTYCGDAATVGVYTSDLSQIDIELPEGMKAIGINAVGEGTLLVTDEGGDIIPGDLLTSSSRKGLATRQNLEDGTKDTIMRSYTVAKAMKAVNWYDVEVDSELGYKVVELPVIYHMGG